MFYTLVISDFIYLIINKNLITFLQLLIKVDNVKSTMSALIDGIFKF